MKILNLFCGIGGNRTLWGNEHEITALDNDQQIAGIYLKRFPNDVVIVGDAYSYLEQHYSEFDFIWASPPCTTHTILMHVKRKKQLPDMRLYSLILFLKYHYHGKWIVENVHPYYQPLIKNNSIVDKHFIWSNFPIKKKKRIQALHLSFTNMNRDIEEVLIKKGINIELTLERLKLKSVVNNTIIPEVGKYILDSINIKTLDNWMEFGEEELESDR